MKLLHYTFRNLSVALGIVLLLWAVFFYIQIIGEVEDETDDSLEYYKERIIQQALVDPAMLTDHLDIMSKYYIREVPAHEADLSADERYDSSIYSEAEMEYVPVRVLSTYFRTADGRYYHLTVTTSTLEKDDLVEAIFRSIVLLYLVLLGCVLAVTHWVFRKSLRPFYQLIDWLKRFKLGKENPPLDNPTRIAEFRILNRTIQETTRRHEELYIRQKEFVENAAHELQTPLAVCLNKLELLSENPACSESQLQEIAGLQRTLGAVVKLNKTLLLLSRIENKQFPDTHPVELNGMAERIAGDLSELYEHKRIGLSIEATAALVYRMNESLAATLLTNLIKNAFIHNRPGGFVEIVLTADAFVIRNSSPAETPLDIEKLFDRFGARNPGSDSTGLGLALVKAIAAFYSLDFRYRYVNCHEFKITFPGPGRRSGQA